MLILCEHCNRDWKTITEFMFTTVEEVSVVEEEEEAGPSETIHRTAEAVAPNRAPRKELKPIASVHKILKFKLLPDSAVPNSTSEHT